MPEKKTEHSPVTITVTISEAEITGLSQVEAKNLIEEKFRLGRIEALEKFGFYVS